MAENLNSHQTEEEGSSILPPELVECILTQLPVKSLIRFKTVSKIWNNIISDSRFIKIQSQAASSSSPRHFLVWGYPPNSTPAGTFCLLKFEDQSFHLDSILGSPLDFSAVRSVCNGIVLLWGIHISNKNYVLWNPYSRVYMMIRWTGSVRVDQGLCYDNSTDDYKVVFITKHKQYSVYACKERTWKIINQECPDFHRIESRGVHVDGKFYWLCYGGQEHGFNYRGLLRYDGSLDKCDKIKLPEAAQTSSNVAQLAGMKGHLAYVLKYSTKIEIWIMEKNGDENSWRKLRPIENLQPQCTLYSQPGLHMCSTGPPCPIDDTMILLFLDCVSFVIYDTSEERIIGEIQNFPDWLGTVLAPCVDHLSFPSQN